MAAGASTRLGEPKQALAYQGETLLQRAMQAALTSACQPVVVVLGANSPKLLPQLEGLPVKVALNPAWEEGMASSIRCGLSKLLELMPEASGVVFMVCDQPYVEASLLNSLIQVKQERSKKIVASAYQETVGTPALFDKTYFPELLALQGQEGAKKVLFRHKEDVASVGFPAGAVDIDTKEDYTSLLRSVPGS